jgi:hypothetical protein
MVAAACSTVRSRSMAAWDHSNNTLPLQLCCVCVHCGSLSLSHSLSLLDLLLFDRLLHYRAPHTHSLSLSQWKRSSAKFCNKTKSKSIWRQLKLQILDLPSFGLVVRLKLVSRKMGTKEKRCQQCLVEIGELWGKSGAEQHFYNRSDYAPPAIPRKPHPGDVRRAARTSRGGSPKTSGWRRLPRSPVYYPYDKRTRFYRFHPGSFKTLGWAVI